MGFCGFGLFGGVKLDVGLEVEHWFSFWLNDWVLMFSFLLGLLSLRWAFVGLGVKRGKILN